MASRRAFLTQVSRASLAAAAAALPQSARAAPEPAREAVRPKALHAGATVALLAPASPPSDPEANAVAVDLVKSFGFVPRVMANAARSTMYLAGTDGKATVTIGEADRGLQLKALPLSLFFVGGDSITTPCRDVVESEKPREGGRQWRSTVFAHVRSDSTDRRM